MNRKNNISQVADLFHIAPSSLRYWDEKGLLRFERNEDNQYRVPSFQTLMDLCDVLLYRSLSLPLKKIGELPEMSLEELSTTLKESQEQLELRIRQWSDSLPKIRSKLEMIHRLEELRALPFTVEELALPAVCRLSFEDPRMIELYVNDPHQATVVLPAGRTGALDYGFFADAISGPIPSDLLSTADFGPRPYLKGLFQVHSDDLSRHNGARFVTRAKELGFLPGPLIGRYLLSAFDGIRYDYYEAWLRLDEQSPARRD